VGIPVQAKCDTGPHLWSSHLDLTSSKQPLCAPNPTGTPKPPFSSGCRDPLAAPKLAASQVPVSSALEVSVASVCPAEASQLLAGPGAASVSNSPMQSQR
jgi:hypothetical protein